MAFYSHRVVVPCGEGNIRVRDLISKAVPRYKKATGKPSDSWVTVHNLRQLDGGILDPDDRLHDVADDREQIIAIYDEATNPNQGDGTSASDDDSENRSPDIFKNSEHQFEPFSRNGIDITGDQLNGTPPPLHVRRGSEPALNRLSPIPPYSSVPADPCKRWSAAPVIEDQKPPSSTPLKEQIMSPPYDYPGERGEGSGEEKLPSSSSASSSASSHHSATTTTLSRFSRDDKRCSIQILSDNTNMGRWAEAADRVIESGGFYGKTEGTRKEPLGGAASTPPQSRNPSMEDRSRPNSRIESSHLVVLNNDGSPLGIHVIPSTDRSGLDQGLLVEGIESDGRVARDGRIQVHDIIIEINDKSLRNVTFHEAQEIFKDAMKDVELRLSVIKRRENRNFVPGTDRTSFGSARKVPTVSLSSRTQAVMLHSNTRRIGKRMTINLQKGQHGLGFSITTRDNPAGGEAPIYIKNILPKGAAIEDGTLRIGDRLLEVNGVYVTGCSQSDVASLLRQISVGGLASLIVSRQEKIADLGVDTAEESGGSDNCPSPKLPRQLPTEKVPEDSLMFPWKQREILTFEIPVHDSERAGLGVSVKGKTSSGPNGSIDLGIFVKNVIHGGAASRDGRLKQNDQLVNINGLSLLGKSNSEAMKTLRTAMHQEYRLRLLNLESSFHLESSNPRQDSSIRSQSPHDYDSQMHQQLGSLSPGMITLTIARRVDGSKSSIGSFSNGVEGFTTPTTDYSGTSDTSDNTVIFNSKKDSEYERNIDGSSEMNHCEDFQLSNPVIQRLTGANNAALRNESYYKATHDTWNNSQFKKHFGVNEKERETRDSPLDANKFGSPTVNLPSRDTILIDDEYDTPSSVGRRISSQSSVPNASAEDHPSDAYVSQSSLEESIAGFSRDQPGRQSMSEKRHATLDAKSTDTYQRNKKAREDREKYRQEMYAEMGLDGDSTTKGSAKEVREVPVDVNFPSTFGLSHSSGSPNILPSTNHFRKNKANKSDFASTNALERLKYLSRFADLKNYKGKSLTLQPSSFQRSNDSESPQHRSLRISPSKPTADLEPSSNVNLCGNSNYSPLKSASSLNHSSLFKPSSPSKPQSSEQLQSPSRLTSPSNGFAAGYQKDNADDLKSSLLGGTRPPSAPILSTSFALTKPKAKEEKPIITRKAVSRSLDREGKKGKPSIGKEFSAIIHSWASCNTDLLRKTSSAAMTRLTRHPSDIFCSSNNGDDFLLRPKVMPSHSTPQLLDSSRLNGISSRGSKAPRTDVGAVGPGLGMRKSSSLESLQTMVQEITMEESGQRAGSGRVPRGRGCNESFRAAVDRSYDAPLANVGQLMETLAEEESESSGSGFGRGNSRQSSLSSSADDKQRRGNKKKQGIFKGLGTMFRFGKHRRSIEHPHSRGEGQVDIYHQENENAQENQFQKMTDNNSHSLHQGSGEQNLSSISGVTLPDDDLGGPSRAERMHQLRAEHQRRHVQRNGMYPTDSSEDQYDSAIKQVDQDGDDGTDDVVNNNTSNHTFDSKLTVGVNHSFSSHSQCVSSSDTLGVTVISSNSIPQNSCPLADSNKSKNKNYRRSLYGSCIRPQRHTPSPPNFSRDQSGCEALSQSFCEPNNNNHQELHRHSLHIEIKHNGGNSNSVVNERLANELRGLIVHKSIPHKPPLPPRNKPINNNYKAPLPPSSAKPAYMVPPSNFMVSGNQSLTSSGLENIIGPDFSFTFHKQLPSDCVENQLSNQCDRNSVISNWKLEEVAQNIANQTQSDFNASYNNAEAASDITDNLNKANDNYITNYQRRNSVHGEGFTLGNCNVTSSNFPTISCYNTHNEHTDTVTSHPLSSTSSSSSGSSQSVTSIRTNSLPRMGLKGKTAAKWGRYSSPCPPPPPPPKGLGNPLAPLTSTEVLDRSQFWRLDPVPPEPKAEIQHIRSRSYDFYGDGLGRPGSRAGVMDPHKFSHYVNYEQIQMHLRKNKEQERLAKLASQQYQDFRDKQTRRGHFGDDLDVTRTQLLSKLEEKFIHESIVASREQREYQSQRCARESSHQQRPVSNYFEYESVQAMMTHAQHNSNSTSTASLPRRHQQPLPQQPTASNQHSNSRPVYPPTHGPTVIPVNSSNRINSTDSGNPKGFTKNFSQSRLTAPYPPFSHSRGQPPPPPQMGAREGHYASSGYRPASQYNAIPIHQMQNTSLTVPDSKV